MNPNENQKSVHPAKRQAREDRFVELATAVLMLIDDNAHQHGLTGDEVAALLDQPVETIRPILSRLYRDLGLARRTEHQRRTTRFRKMASTYMVAPGLLHRLIWAHGDEARCRLIMKVVVAAMELHRCAGSTRMAA
ncbi:MAG: hypothetical protein KF889_04810 [Alphaproteobacteria bacterium]|nr:hypothetical protein [Alphaproteobacteria bacterium]MCW5742188.1 hypothetical protein [Alphaproteobacteria bacterium]